MLARFDAVAGAVPTDGGGTVGTIVALGLLAGTANAQSYSYRHAAPSYGAGPAYCPPGVTFRQTSRVIVAPRVAVATPAGMPAEAAPAVAAAPQAEAPAGGDAPQAEAPADDAPQGEAANPPG